MQRYTKKVAKTKLSATFKIYFFYLRLQSFLFLDGKLKLQSAFFPYLHDKNVQRDGLDAPEALPDRYP